MSEKIKKAGRHVSQSEGLIFEKSVPGKRGMELPPLDVPAVELRQALGAQAREGVEGLPEVSEIEVLCEAASDWNEDTPRQIENALRPIVGGGVRISPRQVEHIERAKSGKIKVIVSHVSKELIEQGAKELVR